MSLSPSPRPLRVLIVEDYTDVRESLCLLIGLWGHKCDSASSGPEATRKAAEFLPDVVLMDIGLPGSMDGYDAAREMRKAPGLAGALFAATTGFGRDEDVGRSRREGFVVHFTKPHDPVELMRFLAHAARAAGRGAGPA